MTKRNTLLVTKSVLSNGLTVILKEMHHAPVASFMIWYRVGSRHEKPGITGISHWVEHMMFKGTPAFPHGSMDRLIAREGGYNNAFTWLDYTAYYETLPAHRIGLALDIEADRMVNTQMTVEEVASERTVILSERGMYENDPRFVLNEEVNSIAFRVHPYHHEIIGDTADLTSMTRDDLFGYYQDYYAPNNAIVVAAGDFDSDEMMAQIKATFGPLAKGKPLPAISRQEPAQKGERRVVVTGSDQTSHLVIGFRAPPANHPDYFPLTLLNAALAGGSSLGMFGSGGSNKSSRLYKALVDSELAASVSGSLVPTIDPFLYIIGAVVHKDHTAEEVEVAVDNVLTQLQTKPISQTELQNALKRAKTEFVMSGESMTGQAQLLGMAEAVVGDYRWFESVLEKLTAVTLTDIERVRHTYLQKRNRVVGWYEPEKRGN